MAFDYKLTVAALLDTKTLAAKLETIEKQKHSIKFEIDFGRTGTDLIPKAITDEIERLKREAKTISDIYATRDTEGKTTGYTLKYLDEQKNEYTQIYRIIKQGDTEKLVMAEKFHTSEQRMRTQREAAEKKDLQIQEKKWRFLEAQVVAAEKFLQRAKDLQKTEEVTEAEALAKQIIDIAGKPFEGLGEGDYQKAIDLVKGIDANSIKQMADRMKTLDSTARQAGNSMWSFGEQLKTAFVRTAEYALTGGVLYQLIGMLQSGVQYVKDLNKELVSIQLVTDMDLKSVQNLGLEYNKLAKELGSTTLEVAKGSLEWIRQGKSVEETQELLTQSTMMSKLANIESAQSTEYLTAMINAYKLSVEDASSVVDDLVAVDNVAATSVKELAEAMQRSSLTAQNAGVGFNELVAMIGTVSSISRRSASTVGEAFKTMFVRFQDIKEGGVDEFGDDINAVGAALDRVEIEIQDTNGEFKSFSQVLDELYPKWAGIGEEERRYIAKAVAGTRQRETLLALLENETMYRKLIAEQIDNEGLAMERYTHYLEGTEAASNQLKDAWDKLWQTAKMDEAIAGLYKFLAGLLDIYSKANEIANKINPWKAIAEGISWLGGTQGRYEEFYNTTTPPAALTGGDAAALTAKADYASDYAKELEKVKEAEKSVAASGGLEKYFLSVKDSVVELEGKLKSVRSLIEKQESGTFGATDIEELSKIYPDYLNLLSQEGGKLELNTDKLKAYALEQVNAQIALAKSQDATDNEIAALEQYADALDRAIPSSREFVSAFNEKIMATSEKLQGAGGLFDDFGEKILTLNQRFEDGLLSTSEYFTQMNMLLSNTDYVKTMAANSEASQIFFTGLVQNATSALTQISSMFDSGKISITDYTEQLSLLGNTFQIVSDMSDFYGTSLGIAGQAASDAAAGVVDISTAIDNLNQLQELNVLVQDAFVQSQANSLQFGTDAFNEYMDKIAYVASYSGQTFTDLQGNVLSGSEQIAAWLKSDAGNFKIFADQTAGKTGKTVNALVRSIGAILVKVGEAIKTFKATITFSPEYGDLNIPKPFDFLNIRGINITGRAEGLTDIGGMISDFGAMLSETDTGLDFDAGIYVNPASIETAQRAAEKLANTAGTATSEFNKLREAMKAAGQETKDQAKSLDDLLKIVVSKIKQEKQAEKERLKESLEGFKRIIDKRKDMLKQMQEEEDYKDRMAEKEKTLSDIQARMLEISLDDSEEAAAERRKLEEQEAEAKKAIEKEQRDKSYDDQEDALDNEYSLFEEFINEKIKVIEDFLSQPGAIMAQAIDIVNEKGSELYDALIAWNKEYGSGIDSDVTSAWNDAYEMLEKYKNELGNLDVQYVLALLAGATTPEYHSGGLVKKYHDGGIVNGGNNSEVFAKLMANEVVVTPNQIGNFFKNTLPELSRLASNQLKFDNLISLNVQGNLDSSVIPDIERVVNLAVDKINAAMQGRGYVRSANQFGI